MHAEGEHGEKKINFWEGPTRISEWKEEQVSIRISCSCGIHRGKPHRMGASGATMLVVFFNIDRKRASQGCLGNDMLNALCRLSLECCQHGALAFTQH